MAWTGTPLSFRPAMIVVSRLVYGLLAGAILLSLSASAQACSDSVLTSASDSVAALNSEPPASTRPLTLLPAQPAISAAAQVESRVRERTVFIS